MEIFVFPTIAAVLLLAWLYSRWNRKWNGYKPIPGPKGLPFLGPVSLLRSSEPHLAFYDMATKYGQIFRLNVFGNNVVMINDPTLIRKAFSGEEYGDAFFNRPKTFVSKYMLVDGIDLAFAEHYDKQTVLFRKMVFKCLQKLSEDQLALETKRTAEIDRLLVTIDRFQGNDFDMANLVKTFVGNMIYILLYGNVPQGKDSKMIWDFSDYIFGLLEITMNLLLSTFPFVRFLPGLPGQLFSRATKAKMQIFEHFAADALECDGLYKTLLDFRKETNTKYGKEVISVGNVKSIILDVIVGGTSTYVTFLAGGILVLMNYQECIRKIQAEIDNVIGKDRKPKLTDKGKMDYTMACIYELLRYMSISSIGFPHHMAEDVEFEGYLFSKDTLVYSNIWFVHHDPNLWHEPWSFSPDRFLDDEGKLLPPSAECRRNIMSFSVGKRSCPGGDYAVGSMFYQLLSILQVYDILPPSNGQVLDPDPRGYDPGLSIPSFKCRAVRRNVTPTV